MVKKPTYKELETKIKQLEKQVRSYDDMNDLLSGIGGSKALLEQASFEGIAIHEDGTISEANNAMSQMTGYEPSELIGMDLLELITPRRRDSVSHNIRSGYEESYEAVCLRKDGSTLPIEIRGRNTFFMERHQMIVSFRNIEEWKQLEKLYKIMAEKSQAGVYIARDRKIIYLNNIVAKYTGYAPEELVGKDRLYCVHPEDKKILTKNLDLALKNKSFSPYMYRIITKDGAVRWIMENVASTLHNGQQLVIRTTKDITEINETKKRLQELETIERSILDAISHAVIGFQNRHIIFANNAVKDVFGWDPQDLIGQSSRVLYRDDEEFDQIGAAFYPLSKKQKTLTKEAFCRKKDGTEMTCLVSISRIGDSIKEKKAVTVYEDVTGRKVAQKRLLDYHSKLRSLASELSLTEERERREIATALHDGIIQTMAVTKIKLEALQKDLSPAQVKDVIALVNQLIYETRSLTLDLSPPILHILGLEAALEWLSEQFQEQHGLSIDLQAVPSSERLDRDIAFFLFRSTRELLMNVVKHAHVKRAKVILERKEGGAAICVKDSGKGFDASKQKALINAAKGFGLFSIRERLDFMGGYFSVESKPGKGTCITMTISKAQEEEGYAHEHQDSSGR